MLDLSTVLSAARLAGSQLPAFKALFDHAVSTFGESDQDKLQTAYADEMKRTDAAHSAVQDAMK